ncbi:hypothetical protein ACRALDRAFT_1073126 [Sodiomyces alcalophilus JCM 7366]|uniref:uncharacterized protein n=1 Tax=Sodiomyces alcalophilus JCM 7366 TaxID=591952 RepID=UPI0039B5331E
MAEDKIDAKGIGQKLVDLTSLLKSPPSTDFAGRLHYKASRSRRAMEFRDNNLLDLGSPWPGYDDNPGTSELGGYSACDRLNYLAQTTVARALKQLNSPLQSKIDMTVCDEAYTEQMGTIAYLCFVEHVNMTLRERPIEVYDKDILGPRKVNNLRDVRMLTWVYTCGFGHNVVGEYLKELLTRDYFIEKIIEDDAGHGDNLRSMCILFLADFMTGDPYTAENGNCFAFRPSFEILQTWSRSLWERKGRGNLSQTKEIIKFCGKVATAVHYPADMASIPSTYQVTTEVYKSILDQDQGGDSYADEIREALKQLIEDDLDTWKSIYTELSGAWLASAYPLWRDAVKKAMEKDDEAIVKQWITDGYYWEDELPYGSKTMLRRDVAPNGAYITAGSAVTMADGSFRNVETLRQGDLLLTSATQAQTTKISREVFPMELTAGLIGFNGEKPFATPAQVFYTTSGLRAVNPHAAMMQNPWAKIGRLAVGHIMYRHKEQPSAQDEYELVEVKSIERTTPEKRIVFALGLDKGVRSHHVNRYLTSLNDPEVRVGDVSALLGKFSPADQLRILSSSKELAPLLGTFDTQTIWERLQLEILEAKKSTNPWLNSTYSASYSSPGARNRSPISRNGSILHLVQGYDLTAVDQPEERSRAGLPHVKMLDGSLLLDGEVQSRAAINDKDRTVSWTRKIAGTEMYEHGQIEIFRGDAAGAGSLFHSSEANPRSLDQGRITKFTAAATDAASPDDTAKSSSFFSRFVSSPSQAATAPKLRLEARWDMTIDMKEWKQGETRTEPQDPASLGVITTGLLPVPKDINLFGATVPAIDEIQDAMNKIRQADGKKPLERMYTYYMSRVRGKDDDGQDTVVDRRFIKLKEATTLLFLSDQGPESTSPFNLTFKKNLGISTTLPVLFQSMYFDRNTEGDEVSGAVFVHDPTKRGNKGSRYYVHGKWAEPTAAKADNEANRLRVSKHFASIARPGIAVSNDMDSQLQPAPITAMLSSTSPPALQRLYSMPYNASDVNSLQQLMINEAMFYHMKDEDRKNFTTRSRPDPKDLGPELTTQLPDDIREWLQNTYAPAFITRSITQIEEFKKKFKTGDTEKVWYWWSGNPLYPKASVGNRLLTRHHLSQGEKCLSNSKEFNKLNRLAAAHAMKKLHPKELDLDVATARQLGADLFAAVSRDVKMSQILEEDDRGDNINKIVAILYTLHPEEKYPDKWFKIITDYAIANTIELPFLKDENGQYVQDYMEESMRQLITKVLSNDPSFTGPVRDQLEKDLNEFMKQNNINQNDSLEKKVSACVSLMASFTVEVARLLTITGNGLARVFGGSKLFLLAGKLAEKAGNAMSKVPMGTKISKGLGALCVVLPLISVIRGWDKLTPAQRVIGVLEPLRAVLSAADKAFEEFKSWRSSKTSEQVKAQDSAVLDGQLRQNITQPQGEGLFELGEKFNPDGGVKGVMAEKFKEGGLPSNDEHIPGESEVWNEEKVNKPDNLLPNEEEAAGKLSTTSKWIRGLNIVLGFAVGAAMTYSLVEEWDKLTDVGKVINTLSVIVQILSVVVDVVDLALTTGLIASSVLSVALPIVGAVLALIGIALMIVSMFVNMYTAEPAPDPVGDFIKNVAADLIKDWEEPPSPKLTYDFTTKGSKDGQGTITVSGENKSSEEVRVAYTQMSIYAGHGEKCLFSDESFHLSTDEDADKGGTLTVSPQDSVSPTLSPSLLRETPTKYWVYNLSLKGKRDEKENWMGNIILGKGKSISAAWAGKLQSSSTIEIVESFTNGDKAHSVLKIDL